MSALLALDVDVGQAILDAFLAFLGVAAIAAAFGFVYWQYRKRKSAREDAARRAWLEERRAQREKRDEPPKTS